MADEPRKRHPWRRRVIVALLLVGVPMSLVCWAHYAREAQNRSSRIFLMSQAISSLAGLWQNDYFLASYKDAAESVPLSWRAWATMNANPIPPGCWSIAPWDAPENACLREHGSINGFDRPPTDDVRCVGIVGDNTLFDFESAVKSFADLPSNLIVLIEIRRPGIHWMQPFDLSTDEIDAAATRSESVGTLTGESEGVAVAFADEHVWLLSSDTPVSVLRQFCRIETAVSADREKLLGPFCVRSDVRPGY